MNEEMVELISAEDESYSNDDLFNITSWGADPSVRELVQAYEENDMLKPELQRNYVWDEKEASRFVESILLGLPVPSIFLANRTNGKRLIVDGYQRIMTVFYFMKNTWAGTGKEFRLYDTEIINERWRGKTYEELSEDDKRRFRTYTIHAIVFEQKQPKNDSALYQIFERINTSGKALNSQEIRNCVYQGDCNSLLLELNKTPEWRRYAGDSMDKRMLDVELILRFFAMRNMRISEFREGVVTLKKLLNDYMGERKVLQEAEKSHMREDFLNCLKLIWTYIGDDAFYNYQADLKTLRRKLYPTIFDSIMIATSIAISRGYNGNESLVERREQLLRDESYRENITQGTMRKSAIHTRVALALRYLYDMEL